MKSYAALTRMMMITYAYNIGRLRVFHLMYSYLSWFLCSCFHIINVFVILI